MKPLVVALAVAFLAWGNAVAADEFKSGPQVGENSGCLQVQWVVGWPYEGKFSGCMPCSLAPRSPVAIIFTQKVDDRVSALIRAVEPKATEWRDKEGPKAFVCGVGGLGHEDLKKHGKVRTRVPPTIAATYEAARKNLQAYKLNDKAAVTVIVYDGNLKVTANFAFRDTKDITNEKVAEVVKTISSEA